MDLGNIRHWLGLTTRAERDAMEQRIQAVERAAREAQARAAAIELACKRSPEQPPPKLFGEDGNEDA